MASIIPGKMTIRPINDKGQITPAKPRQPPASNIQNGLSRVAKASPAAATVNRAAGQVRSEVCAKIRPLAPINPIESGTSAAWMIAGQREWLDRPHAGRGFVRLLAYGALAFAAGLLTWIYVTAAIILLGAEVVKAHDA